MFRATERMTLITKTKVVRFPQPARRCGTTQIFPTKPAIKVFPKKTQKSPCSGIIASLA